MSNPMRTLAILFGFAVIGNLTSCGFSIRSVTGGGGGSAGHTPFVAFKDSANGSGATVMKYSGGAWSVVGTRSFSPGTIGQIVMAVDPTNGTPYVAFVDNANSTGLTVMKYTGSAWSVVGSTNLSAGAVITLSMAIDPSGTPYVVYDDSITHKATVKKYSASAWNAVGGAVSASNANTVTINTDSAGTPYIAYADAANSNGITVQKYTGAWGIVGSANISGGVASGPRLAFDSSGNPVVSYNASGMVVQKYTGAWSILGGAAIPGSVVYNTASIATDSSGTVYAYYADPTNSFKGNMYKYSGSWVAVGPAPFSALQHSYYDFVIDSSGYPIVAFNDQGNGNQMTALSYNGSAWSILGTAGFSGNSTYVSMAYY